LLVATGCQGASDLAAVGGSTLVPAVLMLMDQIAALEWIQRNIAALVVTRHAALKAGPRALCV
jgi:hypothetical protein